MGAKLNIAGWISEQMGGVRLEDFIHNIEFYLSDVLAVLASIFLLTYN